MTRDTKVSLKQKWCYFLAKKQNRTSSLVMRNMDNHEAKLDAAQGFSHAVASHWHPNKGPHVSPTFPKCTV